MASNSDLALRPRDLRAACEAWQSGGTLGLGRWIARYKPHFSVFDYAALVELVRSELDDTQDYSKEG